MREPENKRGKESDKKQTSVLDLTSASSSKQRASIIVVTYFRQPNFRALACAR